MTSSAVIRKTSLAGAIAIRSRDNYAQDVAEFLVILGGADLLGHAHRLVELFQNGGYPEAAARWEAIATIMGSVITREPAGERPDQPLSSRLSSNRRRESRQRAAEANVRFRWWSGPGPGDFVQVECGSDAIRINQLMHRFRCNRAGIGRAAPSCVRGIQGPCPDRDDRRDADRHRSGSRKRAWPFVLNELTDTRHVNPATVPLSPPASPQPRLYYFVEVK